MPPLPAFPHAMGFAAFPHAARVSRARDIVGIRNGQVFGQIGPRRSPRRPRIAVSPRSLNGDFKKVDEVFDLLTAALLPGVGPRKVRDLGARGSLGGILARPEEHADLLSPQAIASLRSGEAAHRATRELETARRLGDEVLGWSHPLYPALLHRAYDPPPVLYVRGEIPPANEQAPAIAIVGARAASAQGRAWARALGRDLAAAGATVVSGLARGIDTAAHEGALLARGRTVAVLGSSLDRLYPRENATLAATISGSGAVVSEFPYGTEPHAGNFPRRNRVLAAWSRAVVVVEAAARSGALITARCALEEGREVMAVPGHPSHRGSEGTNQLLKDGAALVRHAHDVAAELGLELAPAKESTPDEGVLACFRPDVPASLDELCERTGQPLPQLLAELSRLEVEARVQRLPGLLYLRISPERV
jgi:DNA processing protein